jgi:hypothetical protein
MRHKLLPLLLIFALISCDSNKITRQRTPYELAYRATSDKIMAQPLNFKVTKATDIEAWGRANLFLARFGDMKLQIISDHILETYNPFTASTFGYSIARGLNGDSIEYAVTCAPGAIEYHNAADTNAHVLATYIARNELADDHLWTLHQLPLEGGNLAAAILGSIVGVLGLVFLASKLK